MSGEEEKIKKIAELRELLEERAKNLETELDGLRSILDYINNLLLEKSFRRVEEIVKPVSTKPPEAMPTPVPPREQPKSIPLKTGTGEVLANLYVEGNLMRTVPGADKKFDVDTPPFTAFFLEKILARMQETDQEAARNGEITPNEVLSFDVQKEGNMIREIIIQNVNPQREREIRSALRWTLEKMHEKTKSSS